MKNSDSKSKKKSSSSARKRNHSVSKQLSRIMEDENTTNSEASEHGVYSDINWEENLEVDTTSLLEEFAPKTLPKPNTVAEKPLDNLLDSSDSNNFKGFDDEPVKPSAAVEFELGDIESPSDYHIGLKLLILHYKTNQWVEGSVEEIDQDEEEVLVRYESGSESPEEWLAMKSQRIKRKVSLVSSDKLQEALTELASAISSSSSSNDNEMHHSAKPASRESLATNDTSLDSVASLAQTPSTPTLASSSKSKRKRLTLKKTIKRSSFKKTVAISSKVTQRRAIRQDRMTSRRMPVWKSGQHVSKLSNSVVLVSDIIASAKFKEGEKVLAKWSDHRMQKFPAVIKGVCGEKLYDVLFYDGFEKTIAEDNIYKSTEEEMAKYKESKPSEADSFVEMDSSSKHERRQKKRKTFDGFFEEKDFKRPRKLDSFDLNRSESFQRASFSRNKATMQSFSVHTKKLTPTSATTKGGPVLTKPMSVASPKPDAVSPKPLFASSPKPATVSSKPSLTPKIPTVSQKPASVSPKSTLPPKTHPGAKNNQFSDNKSGSKLSEKVSEAKVTEKEREILLSKKIPLEPKSSPLASKSKLSPNPIVSKSVIKDDIKDSIVDTEDSYKYPLEITCHDGKIRKSILIDDNKLPYGWTKHVIDWIENRYACFLFTPDKYAVHSVIELRKYFKLKEGQELPQGLDFIFRKESLMELIESQKNLVPRADYRKWVNKILDERKVMKKVRILPPSRSIGPGGHFTTKRVRTLLPRYRTHIQSSGKSTEGKVWRCPKADCAKKFRKENLLQMHIKHYHRDLRELAGSAPNVVDLALARTSAVEAFSFEPVKRASPKPGLYEQHGEKSLENSGSAVEVSSTESKVGPPSTSVATPSGPTNKSSASSPNLISQPVISSLKVLTPSKNLLKPIQKSKNDVEVENKELEEFKDKARTNITPKSVSKKIVETKSGDNMAYLSGSRALKKKQQPAERTYVADSSSEFTFPEDELRDDGTVLERLQSEEIINCICGFKEEDGLMVQCEICLCWQHGTCHGMEKDLDVPERYVCTTCLDPLHVRSSQRYSYANHYLTLTKLPRFNYRTCKEDVLRHREKILSKSFELTSNLQSIHRMERALAAKINIAQQSDHPKLYLWSTNWDSSKRRQVGPFPKKTPSDSNEKGRRGPVGEAPIESIDCRLRLLDRIESDQQDMESRLTIIQAQLQALESEDFDVMGEESDGGGGSCGDPLLKQAIYMLLRDLSTIATATSLS